MTPMTVTTGIAPPDRLEFTVPAPFLTRACAESRARVQSARQRLPVDYLARQAGAAAPAPSFTAALLEPGLSVIAEIKRSSPSRGHIADIPDPVPVARAYAAGGAAAVSVLTEPMHFSGSLSDLRHVAANVHIPVLRKDFIVDEYQMAEARAHGAAAALLIVAALTDKELTTLVAAADLHGLDVLIETHTEREVDRAATAHQRSGVDRGLIIGVNARNLTTLDVDLGIVERVARSRPPGVILVAESGVRGPADAARMAELGADAVLVGEHVAMARNPAAAVAALRAAAPIPTAGATPSTATIPPATTPTENP